ncbi:MAG TPA: methionyl-tRNA formyltransferase [Pyrinomonadaceae bacterium]|nr:methionyl-tRNA formyltransferase [Pyrinomonadaceae bacterium]
MRIVFMGTPRAAVPTLQRCVADGHEVVAVWTQPDRPAGRGHRMAFSPVKEFAVSHGLSVFQPVRLKNDDALNLFASHDADLAVVVAYGRILPERFLQTPRRGCINVHFSLLPLYRGAAPANWAIVNGETETGVTTMFIEPALDTGPILLQRKSPIGDTETAPELMDRLSETGAELLGETLSQLDHLTPRPQHDRDATFAPILKKEDGSIDWSRNAIEIERCVRGFQPWPNAYTSFNGKGLTIWRAQSVSSVSGINPGEVLAAHGDDLLVQCGEQTALRLIEVQPEARKRIGVRDFINGMHVKVGDRLGREA